MGLSSRYYLFAEDGVHRIAKRVVEGLVQGIDALPNYAGTTQKAAVVTVENDAKGVARIKDAVGEFWHFDELGKINKSLQKAAWAAVDRLTAPSSLDREAVVDLSATLKRKRWEREHRWELSKADLDLIAADLHIVGEEAVRLDAPIRPGVRTNDAATGAHHVRPERWHRYVIRPRVRAQDRMIVNRHPDY
jgi:hypothetical protein